MHACRPCPLLEYKIPKQKGSLVEIKGAKGWPERLTQDYSVDGKIV
jgi:hypothetical protein